MTHAADVFLSYNRNDQDLVKAIDRALNARGIVTWLDEWRIRPGVPWEEELEQATQAACSVAVFIGSDGLGDWGRDELSAFRHRAVKEKIPLIPVLLPGAPDDVDLPPQLQRYHYVDMRRGITEQGLDRLVWGIKGEPPDGLVTSTHSPTNPKPRPKQDAPPNTNAQQPQTYKPKGGKTKVSLELGGVGLVLIAVVVAWLFDSGDANNLIGRIVRVGEGGVSDARITLSEYALPPVVTSEDGTFALAVGASVGTSVRLRVDRDGQIATEHYCIVGAFCEINLLH